MNIISCNGFNAVRNFVRTRTGSLAISLTAACTFLVSQAPGVCEQLIHQYQWTTTNPQRLNKTAKPSRDDILLVRLADGADTQRFDDLLNDVHGTVLNTITITPTIKYLVVQTEPGQAADVEKKFSATKDIAQVQRNTIYRIKDDVTSAEGSGGSFGHSHFHLRLSKVTFGHSHGSKGISNTGSSGGVSNPPVVNGTTLAGTSNDPFFASQWDLNMMNYTQARDSGAANGTPVPFYLLDTGYTVSSDSPAMVIQYNFADPINPSGGQESIFDSGTHGTETGTVTAFSDNYIGYTGMANLTGQRVMLYVLRISADGQSAGLVNILSALAFIANNGFLPGPVNLSFNNSAPNTLNANSAVQQAAGQLLQKGSMLVLASGNDGAQDPSPEQYIRRVAAVDFSGSLASFSNFGPFPAAAPGVAVAAYTSSGPSFQSSGSGTSFAAPRWCAAMVDVMGAMSPANRSAANADLILRQTGTVNPQGYVIPNLAAAMQSAAGW